MFSFESGMNAQGDVYIPFSMESEQIPFSRWRMVSAKVWDSPGPVVVRNIILTNDGQLYVQYIQEVNDASEYPKEEVVEMDVVSKYPPEMIRGESLVESDEKRSYK